MRDPKLAQLNPKFAIKVAAVLADLRGKGWDATIAEAWRSPASQLRKFRRGFSKVRWGFHCATTQGGKPDALAADIVDQRWYWRMPVLKLRLYRKHIMSSAKAHGLTSGATWRGFGLWGDFAHLQWKGISIEEAKAGKRP